MKAARILIGLALVVSVALNVWLWQQREVQLAALETARAGTAEAEVLRAENETLKTQRAAKPATSDADARELAKLRSEVGQLRKQAAVDKARVEAADLARQAALSGRNNGVTPSLQQLAAGLAAEKRAELEKEVESLQCINNLRQLGAAARIWASDHKDIFPPDFLAMKEEIGTPKLLCCPSSDVFAGDWPQMKPAMITYRFLNPNGNESDPSKPLMMCPIHGHVGLCDSSVQAKQ